MSRTADRSRVLWLFLLAQGGWWTTRELLLQRPEWNNHRKGTHIGNTLRVFAASHTCMRRLRQGCRDYEHAVTPDCGVPTGIAIKDVMEAIE